MDMVPTPKSRKLKNIDKPNESEFKRPGTTHNLFPKNNLKGLYCTLSKSLSTLKVQRFPQAKRNKDIDNIGLNPYLGYPDARQGLGAKWLTK